MKGCGVELKESETQLTGSEESLLLLVTFR